LKGELVAGGIDGLLAVEGDELLKLLLFMFVCCAAVEDEEDDDDEECLSMSGSLLWSSISE
jgi:hypothetical protein